MTIPSGIQLRRTRGFRLQAFSRSLNGLPAVKVDRTSPYGNPWRPMRFYGKWVLEERRQGLHFAYMPGEFATQLEAVEFSLGLFRQMVEADPHPLLGLRGKNLACWCALDQPCHRNVLLELANARPTT
jgi:hypothetical protein